MTLATRVFAGLVSVLLACGMTVPQAVDPPAVPTGVVAMAADGGQPWRAVPGLPPPLRTRDMGRTMAYWPVDAGS
ncbi:MAG: hypothetical protein FJY99_09375 [Candidatus Sericytochromatia bacterium]|nr:hypothetical protein [Candidatus Tanganyikabacteria bacterium]